MNRMHCTVFGSAQKDCAVKEGSDNDTACTGKSTKAMYKAISFSILNLFLVVVLNTPGITQDVGYCDGNQYVVDLSDDINGVWNENTGFTPEGPCCGIDKGGCIELIIYLHPDAAGFQIEFDGAPGAFGYLVDCDNYSNLDKDEVINFCNTEIKEYYVITFCRPGKPTYKFVITSQESAVEEVSLAPFADMCGNDNSVPLTGGFPAGGEYFIVDNEGDAVAANSFDPAVYGLGEHTIRYIYLDEDTGCYGMDEQTITVHDIPELTCQDHVLCEDAVSFNLADQFDQLPSGGQFLLNGNVITAFDPGALGHGSYSITYAYTDANTGCDNSCEFIITVNSTPVVQNLVITLCDDDDQVNVNLNDYASQVNGSAGVDYVFYHEPELTTEITNPTNYTTQNGDVVSVLVTNNDTGCYASAQIEFEVGLLIDLEDITLEYCDESDDDSQMIFGINLRDFNALYYGAATGITFSWYYNSLLTQPVVGNIDIGDGDVFYLEVSDGICSDVATLSFDIHPLPNLSCEAEPVVVCRNLGNIDLVAEGIVSIPGGTFSGPGVVDNVFDPGIAGPGNHTIIYELADVNGCEASCSFVISVKPLAQVECPDDLTFCINAGIQTLGGVSPTGGSYSGPGIIGETAEFDPALAGEGTHTITYTIEEDGCEDFCEFEITVNPLPVIDCPTDMDVCINSPAVALPSSPGVSYDGTGIFLSGGVYFFDPSTQGIHNIEYKYTDPGTLCANTCFFTIEVHPLPVMVCDDIQLCKDSDPIVLADELTVLPAGGVFSLNGTDITEFNPTSAGTFLVIYTYTDGNFCINTCTIEITVYPLPIANHITLSLCSTTSTVDGLDLTYYQNSVNNQPGSTFTFFDPLGNPVALPKSVDVADGDIYEVIVTHSNGCENTGSITFEIGATIQVNPQTFDFCDASVDGSQEVTIDLEDYNYQIFPGTGYTYTWYEDATLSIAQVPTTITITNTQEFYIEVSDGSCSADAPITFEVHPLPTVDCPGNFSVCIDGGTVDLTVLAGITPLGGVFTGNGVSGGVFDPVSAGVDTHFIYYTYTDPVTECINICTFNITVDALPDVDCPANFAICIDGGVVNLPDLPGVSPIGGVFSGAGITAGTDVFDPIAADVGLHVITYTYTYPVTGCDDFCTFEITVNELPQIDCPADLSICEDAGLVPLSGATPSGGVYSYGTPDVVKEIGGDYFFDSHEVVPGTFTLEYTYIHPVTGCESSCSFDVVVNPLPDLDCSDLTVCRNSGQFVLADEFPLLPSAGVFTRNGNVVQNFNPTTVGDFNLVFTYTDANQCTQSCNITITVTGLPQAISQQDVLCSPRTDGVMENVDLTAYEAAINDGAAINYYYYRDAGLQNFVSNPQNATVNHNQIFYVVVENDITYCSSIASLRFEVGIDFDAVDTTIGLCDESIDGSREVYEIQLQDFNQELFTAIDGVSFTWYPENNLTEPITEPLSVSHGQYFTVVITDGICEDQAIVAFDIYELPQPVCTYAIEICPYDEAIDLTSHVTPGGGVFSGPGVSGHIFDPLQAGDGTHTIHYVYTDGNGCQAACSVEILVKPLEPAVCPDDMPDVCIDSAPVPLVVANPVGGVYSSSIHSAITLEADGIYYFHPQVAGPGSHSITYSVEEDNCEDSCTFNIVVNSLPLMQCPVDPFEVCQGNEPISLSGIFNPNPAGGVFRFQDEDISVFTPSTPGSYEFTYTYIDVNGCEDSCEYTLIVNSLPELSWDLVPAFCPNIGLAELTGTLPAAGEYSGMFVEEGTYFNTDMAETGNHLVTYTYWDENGCSSSLERQIEIYQAPVANAGEPLLAEMCGIMQLDGSATEGQYPYSFSWSPAALLDNHLVPDPYTIPLGGTTVFNLTVTDQNSCSDTDEVVMVVENSMNVNLPAFEPLCVNEGFVELKGGTPLGGKYYINEQTSPSTIFIPGDYPPGEHTITYVYKNFNGCTGTAVQTITVYPLPDIQWTGMELCAYSGQVELTEALPEGGIYSGNHVNNNYFHVGNAGPGLYSVSYNFIDENGCSAIKFANIAVHELPNADAGLDQTIEAGTTTQLQAADGGDGIYDYHWSPAVLVNSPNEQNTLTRQLIFAQIFNLEVVDQATGCIAKDVTIVNISGGEVEVSYTTYPESVCAGDEADLEVIASGGTAPYFYFWYEEAPWENPGASPINSGLEDNPVFTVIPTETTTYYLVVQDQDGNEATGSAIIIVNPMPDLAIGTVYPLCANNPKFSWGELGSPEGGYYAIFNEYDQQVGGPYKYNTQFNLADIGEGDYQLQYELENEFGCMATTQTDLTILPYVNAEFFVSVTDRCRSNEVLVRNNSTGADTIVWTFEGNPELPDDWTPETTEFLLVYPIEENALDYAITLYVEDDTTGCNDEMSRMVTVHPRAQVQFSGLENGCAPLTLNLTDESTGDLLYYFWRFGDGTASMETNPEKTWYNYTSEDITYNVNLTIATQNYYCTETYEAQVVVYPQTEAGFALDPVKHCSPYNARFYDAAVHADWYHWDFGDGNTLEYTSDNKEEFVEHSYENNTSDIVHHKVVQTIGLTRNGEDVCTKTFEKDIEIFPYIQAEISTLPYTDTGILEGCAPFEVNFSAVQSINVNHYSWVFGDGATSSRVDTTRIFYNNTAETIIYEVELWVESEYGCMDHTTLQVHVHPQIEASFNLLPQTGCSPLEIDLQNTSVSGSNMTFSWRVDGVELSTEKDPDLTLSHNESTLQQLHLEMIAVNVQGCVSEASTDISVYPQVTAQIETTPELIDEVVQGCAPFDLQLFASSSVHADSWLWDMGYGDVSSTEENPFHTFEKPGTYTVQLSAYSSYGCNDHHQITVIVHPAPNPVFALDVTEGCSPLDVNVSYNSTKLSDAVYTWDYDSFGEDFDVIYQGDPDLPSSLTFTNTSQGIRDFDVLLSIETEYGCRVEYTQAVSVWPELSAAISTMPGYLEGEDLTACGPVFQVEFDGEESLNAEAYLWDFGDGITSSLAKPVHSFLNFDYLESEIYEVLLTVTSSMGCIQQQSMRVKVDPAPIAVFTADPQMACSPAEINFSNYSLGSSVYQWDFGDGNTSEQPSPRHEYEVTTDEKQTIFTAQLQVLNEQGCSDVFENEIPVYPSLVAGFEIIEEEGCDPLTLTFRNTTQGDKDLITYKWDYGDGNTSTVSSHEHQHTFRNFSHDVDASFTVRLTAYYGNVCVDIFTHEITVLARPKARFEVLNSPGCAPHAIEVANLSLGATRFRWDFNDGSDNAIVEEKDPEPHMYYQPADSGLGEYNIVLQVEGANGCTHEFSQMASVYPEIEALFKMNISEGCHPLEVEFENLSSGATSFLWDFGDGYTTEAGAKRIKHTFYNFSHTHEVEYEITLWATSDYGCNHFHTEVVRVDPVPLASFFADSPGGCSPLDVVFTNSSIGADSFSWDFDNGTVSQENNPAMLTYHVEDNSQFTVYTPTLEVANNRGCTDLYSKDIYVFPDIIAAFETDIVEACHPLTVEFTNTSLGDEDYFYFEWDYGDGNTSHTSDLVHQHTFLNYSHTQDISYTVSLTAYYGDVCFDVFEKVVTVLARPLADFSVPNSPGCSPHAIEIDNQSQGVINYSWDMGDGGEALSMTQPNPHLYSRTPEEGPGNYLIRLDVTGANGCTHHYTREVTIYPTIEALFQMNDSDNCHPLEVTFENLSSGASRYDWNLGDGTQSLENQMSHTYFNYGYEESKHYQVQLSVYSDYGCESHFTDEVIVRPLPKAQMSLSQTAGCAPFSPQLENKSLGGDSFLWDFGDGNTSQHTQYDAPHYTWQNHADATKKYQVKLISSNGYGCQTQTEELIRVYPLVLADFGTSDDIYSGCSPFDVRFVNQSQLGNTYQWNFGDGGTSISANPLHSFWNTGADILTYHVNLEAESAYGCTDSIVKQINVYPTPEADFRVAPLEQPYPATTFAMENLTNPGQWDFQWSFGDGNTSNTQDRKLDHTYVWDASDLGTKTYEISLKASNEYCYDIRSRRVTITSPVPYADMSAVLQGCQPLEVEFTNRSLYSNYYRWNFGDGALSFDQNPVHTFVEPGLYEVKLIAFGDGGSDTLIVEVEVFANPVADFTPKSNLVYIPHEPLELVNESELAAFYHWEFGDGNHSTEPDPVYYYQKPGVYDITLTAYTDTDPQCVNVKVLKSGLRADQSCQVIFPNAFTPSLSGPSDGAYNPNDPDKQVFHPIYEGVEEYVLEIYSRWGELIFRSIDPDIGWDGYVRGQAAPMGVYVYKVKARCSTGRMIDKAGDVTLIR